MAAVTVREVRPSGIRQGLPDSFKPEATVYAIAFDTAVRDIRMLRIEEMNDLMPVVQRLAGMTDGDI